MAESCELPPPQPLALAESADPDDEDECYGALKRSFVQEWKVLEALVQSMNSSGGDVDIAEIKKAQRIVCLSSFIPLLFEFSRQSSQKT